MKRILSLVFLSFSFLIVPVAHAGKDPIYTKTFNNYGAGGYDVVSFFDSDTPVKGDKKFSVNNLGADFLFSTQENLEKFVAAPEAYLPQYGGYCAWAMADSKFFKGDPKQWTVLDGKLYLNYSEKSKQSGKLTLRALYQPLMLFGLTF